MTYPGVAFELAPRETARRFCVVVAAIVAVSCVATSARAQQPAQAAGDPEGALLRGGAFELGPVGGGAIWDPTLDLASCAWMGVRIGHRFGALAAAPRIELGFRTNLEGCFSHRPVADATRRTDMVFPSFAVWTGWRASERLVAYWTTGMGLMIADTTPGAHGMGKVEPRIAGVFGPGASFALGRYWVADASVLIATFENFENLQDNAPHRTVYVVIPALMLGVQL